MSRHAAVTMLACLLLATAAHAAVDVTAPPAQITPDGNGRRTIQTVTLANEVNSYTLVYDYNTRDDKPGEATSTWWGWTVGYIPIGMTAPSNANWYWQAFLNWTFDDEDLSKRPAKFSVIRSGGQDGIIEFAWDTPRVKATIRFGLASGNEKLFMFGSYEPKGTVKQSRLKLVCYPATFEQPRNRAVTTALGTRLPGETVQLDLARERWVLYEDTTPKRPAAGSAGLLIGTPQAFSKITIPVADYGIETLAELRPEARSFALGLYDFPSMPDYEPTRTSFRAAGDAEAVALGKIAAAGTDQLMPSLPMDPSRMAQIRANNDRVFQRPAELWRPADRPLDFPWAARLPGGPIKVSLLVPRFRAWESMELARRLQMDVKHLYFDGDNALTQGDYWPYAGTTGVAQLPYGLAMQRAVELSSDPNADLIFCPGLTGAVIPTVARQAIVKQVEAGKGLLLAGPSCQSGWPPELFKVRDEAKSKAILAGLDWDKIPGLGPTEPGHTANQPVVDYYSYGQGRVVVLRVSPTTYGCLVPRNTTMEGQDGVLDRSLGLAARAAAAAGGRPWQCPLTVDVTGANELSVTMGARPAGQLKQVVRVQDDLDRTLLLKTEAADAPTRLPKLPAGRAHFLDVAVLDAGGNTLGYASKYLPAAPGPTIEKIALSPTSQMPEALTPRVMLPQGGKMQMTAEIKGLSQAGKLTCQVRDSFDRVLAVQSVSVPVGGGKVSVTFTLGRPVTVAHVLDLTLSANGQELATQRQRFAIAIPYPYDDFTALLWSYGGGDPVLQRTDRMCYDAGADMMDLCHMGGYDDAAAARQYNISARTGLRLLPYVTWMGGKANQDGVREPCLHDPKYLADTSAALTKTCRQAAVYSPAGYTLGDENRLNYNANDCCFGPYTIAAFREWLQRKYGNVAKLNDTWATSYTSFAEVQPPRLEEAAKLQQSFAPWIDHKSFMDSSFAGTHDKFAEVVRSQDPGARVGWDGITCDGWQAGCDFRKLTRNLNMDQVYNSNWMQGDFIRSWKQPGALTGKWGNGVADKADGWHAFPWACLLDGDNSVWWWTSWGCEYIPFNPDLSTSTYGQWFWESVAETAQGPGKLLLHARRDHSGIAVMHSQQSFLAAAINEEMKTGGCFASDGAYLAEEGETLHALRDYGCQYQNVTPEDLEQAVPSVTEYKLIWLPYATCLSDALAANLRKFVEAGGTLVVDGRAGLLTGDGKLRDSRALDDLLGVKGEAGLPGFQKPSAAGKLTAEGTLAGASGQPALKVAGLDVEVLEPGLLTSTGTALARVGNAPVLIVNRVGKGCVITLNLSLQGLASERAKVGAQGLETIVAAVLQAAGVSAACDLKTTEGNRPLCLLQVHYTDGPLHYLAIQQDILMRGLGEQKAHLALPEAAYVYDLRAGKPLTAGKSKEWDISIERGWPLVYSLLPYQVKSIQVGLPKAATRGSSAVIKPTLLVSSGQPGFHVLRLNVFAPGSTQPHRQYSQNLACPAGQGRADIPFALNDPAGNWRLELRDVATGVKTTAMLSVK